MRQCIKIEESYTYEECREIKTVKDIEDFDCAIGNFHDTCIEKQKMFDSGELYRRFTGI